jgi:hypothetical protein
MSRKGRAGRAAWAANAANYHEELTAQIVKDSHEKMAEWAARGRVPLRVRIASRLAGRPVRLPRETDQ